MKKIRKYSTSLFILNSIILCLLILSLLLILIYIICYNFHQKCLECILILIVLVNIFIDILSIILSVHYFKSNFGDFRDFSKYNYLNRDFKKHYDCVFIKIVISH